jgi:short-subunit dehydrogenase
MITLVPGFALITGASSGLGAALARALPADRPLLLSGRDAGRLEALKAELAHGGRPVEIVAADLAGESGRRAVIEAASARPLALLVNNAGLGAWGRFQENDPARELEMVQVNCVAPVALTRALLPRLLENARQQAGRAGLILVASTAAFQPLPNFATYAASKAFDRFLGEALAQELAGQPVAVLTLCPGPTATQFFARAALPGVRARTMAAEQVARRALAALGRCDRLVPGRLNALSVQAASLLPRVLARPAIRYVMGRLLKPGA